MKTAGFQYKCRKCGALDGGLSIAAERALFHLIATVGGKPLKTAGFTLTMLSTHHCKDTDGNYNGSVGVTDLIGFKVTGK